MWAGMLISALVYKPPCAGAENPAGEHGNKTARALQAAQEVTGHFRYNTFMENSQ